MRHELIHGLKVPTRLARTVAGGLCPERSGLRVIGQAAIFIAPEVLPLQFEIGVRRVSIGRPFQDPIHHPKTRPAAETVGNTGTGRVDIVVAAIPGRCAQVRNAGAPRRTRADVTSNMAKQTPGVRHGVPVAVRARECAPAPQLCAQLDEEVRRRNPFQLQAVVVQSASEKRLVGQRSILKIPGVLMDFVLVADCRKESPALQREAATEGEALEIRLLDLDKRNRRLRLQGSKRETRNSQRETRNGFQIPSPAFSFLPAFHVDFNAAHAAMAYSFFDEPMDTVGNLSSCLYCWYELFWSERCKKPAPWRA